MEHWLTRCQADLSAWNNSSRPRRNIVWQWLAGEVDELPPRPELPPPGEVDRRAETAHCLSVVQQQFADDYRAIQGQRRGASELEGTM